MLNDCGLEIKRRCILIIGGLIAGAEQKARCPRELKPSAGVKICCCYDRLERPDVLTGVERIYRAVRHIDRGRVVAARRREHRKPHAVVQVAAVPANQRRQRDITNPRSRIFNWDSCNRRRLPDKGQAGIQHVRHIDVEGRRAARQFCVQNLRDAQFGEGCFQIGFRPNRQAT